MKRLIYCLDGTWNKYDADYPTNVVIFHKTIAKTDPNGNQQIAYYDKGVGTALGEKILGGTLGLGLINNVMQAYADLCEKYEFGDEIYIVGFSRGAYTARSYAGLIKLCGIIDKPDDKKLGEALSHYKKRNSKSKKEKSSLQEWRERNSRAVSANEDDYSARAEKRIEKEPVSPIVPIRYIGVWDTVKTLGIIEKLYDWHDHSLSTQVVYARHAVALDEMRSKFNVTEWENIEELNALAVQKGREARPYQQKWFPGGHGSVGGGGPVRGLSDEAFDWILDGAREAGLHIRTEEHSQVFTLKPNPLDWLDNSVGKAQTLRSKVMGTALKLFKSKYRSGPKSLEELSHTAKVRYFSPSSLLPEQAEYRPASLDKIILDLGAMEPPFNDVEYRALVENAKQIEMAEDEEKYIRVNGELFKVHVVKKGEWLSTIARDYSGNVTDYKVIHEANRATIDDPDRIYVGQRILIPESLIKNNKIQD
jgi:uncharacterized protein (DUF2235 family)/dUTPase